MTSRCTCRGAWPLLFRFVSVAFAAATTAIFAQAVSAACLLGLVERAAPAQYAMSQPVPALLANVAAGQVRVTFLGHSSFLIETPGGASAVTDYNGFNRPSFLPDIVTMNNSHETHYTDAPEAGIRFVLQGWKPGGRGMAQHDIRHKDLRVFNVPTNIGEYGDPTSNGNSIFVFEISNLCIAHLGHLHHVLTKEQLKVLGRIDVLFVPIDGSSTIHHPEAITVIEQIAPRLVIPMHFGFLGSPEMFFELAKGRWPIRSEEGSTLMLSRAMLPKSTEIRFLQGTGMQ